MSVYFSDACGFGAALNLRFGAVLGAVMATALITALASFSPTSRLAGVL
jgi:hypothetical protein